MRVRLRIHRMSWTGCTAGPGAQTELFATQNQGTQGAATQQIRGLAGFPRLVVQLTVLAHTGLLVFCRSL